MLADTVAQWTTTVLFVFLCIGSLVIVWGNLRLQILCAAIEHRDRLANGDTRRAVAHMRRRAIDARLRIAITLRAGDKARLASDAEALEKAAAALIRIDRICK
ncbi:MAG: hypothetical protein ACR650_07665 [Methylocystis sp.]|jgi:hypothetical protein